MFPQKTKINPPVGVVGTGGKYNNRLNIKVISDGNTGGGKAIGMVAASFHFGWEKQSSVLRCLLVRCHTIIDCNDGGKKEDVCMANSERYINPPVGVVGTGGKYNNRLNIKVISDGNTGGGKAIGMVAASFQNAEKKQSSVLRCLFVRCRK